jgi:flagellar basal-body rod modification protein FlgD
MSVTSVGSSTSTTSAASSATAAKSTSSASTVDYNSFLKLLIAQLKNQDPTQPVDSTQYISQLASFSNVEQSVQMNSKLDSLITSMSLGQADGLIGRTVTSSDGTISGQVAAINIASDGAKALLTNGKTLPIGAGITIS